VFLVVGLGNPGQKYQYSRHNIGFRIVDNLSEQHQWIWKEAKRFQWCYGKIDSHQLYLVKPQTYMNLSGLGLLSFLSYIAKSFEDKIIVHDELDLPPGRIRISRGGGAAGHKGILSIAEYFNLENFIRLRVGVGKPIQKDEITEYVLLKPPSEEAAVLADSEKRSVEALICIVTHGVQYAMNRFNSISAS
jgi:PTH1 family peptidyl-tRNA hydrolase